MFSAILEDTERTCDQKDSNQSGKTVSVKFTSVLARTSICAAVKSIEADSSKGQSLSRVSARRFTRSHIVQVRDLQATDFSAMDSSAVISAWGLSRPSVNLLSTYLDIHRVLSADIADLSPTNGDLFQGIGNSDSFIEEGDLGTDKTQVKKVSNEQAPRDCGDNSLGVFGVETLASDSSAENVDSSGKEVTTSRTVHLRITHTSSLSRKVLR